MKKIVSAVLAIVMLASMFTVSFAAEETLLIAPKPEKTIEFSDVNRDTVSGAAIYKLVEAGILLGDGNGKFRPNDPISRGELTKIVNMLFSYTEKATEGFKDVTTKDWYYDNVLIAKKAGYIQGHDDGTFRGDDQVTREQACAILCRVAKLEVVAEDVKINDEVSDWAVPYVQKVLGNKLMNLDKDGKFRATQNITRSEFSTTYASFYVPAAPKAEVYEVEVSNKNGKVDATFEVVNGEIFVTLADKYLLSTSNKTTVVVKKDGAIAAGVKVTVTDKKANKVTLTTDKNGKIEATIKADQGGGGGGGNTTTNNNNNNNNPTPEPDPEPEINYAEVNKDMLEKLNAATKDITANINNFKTEQSALMIYTINECIKKVINDGQSKVIEKNYLVNYYGNDIDTAKGYFEEIKADPELKAAFVEEASSLTSSTVYWLLEAFDIDANDLGVTDKELNQEK